jgi:hypothetical protein
MRRNFAQVGNRVRIALACVVRVHAGRGEQPVRPGQRRGVAALLDRSAGDDDGLHARGTGAGKHRVEVLAKSAVREVCADVREMHRGAV